MAPFEKLGPDWRDAAAYAPLLAADRSIFAWEWLRRDPAYREAAAAALSGAGALPPERWGLHAFEPPDRWAPHARPIWSAAVHGYVLAAEATAAPDAAAAFDVSRLEGLATLARDAGGDEHLLISDGVRAIRLDVSGGSVGERPARLRYRLEGLSGLDKPLLTLRRLVALWRTGRFARSLHPPEARARRWILLLRAYDALAAGADQREIAAFLLNRAAAGVRWRSEAPSLRLRAQRLVRGARSMAGTYLELLR